MGGARRRRGARKQVEVPAFYETWGQKNSATLREISYSGARFETGSQPPEAGEPIRVYVWPAQQDEPAPLAGTVVNVDAGAFAVAFTNLGQELCQWIDTLPATAPEIQASGARVEEAIDTRTKEV